MIYFLFCRRGFKFKNRKRYREMILERVGTKDPTELFQNSWVEANSNVF